MPLVQAKCPNCASSLKVDARNESAICEYCGTPFIVEKAINLFNTTVNSTINVANGATVIYTGVNKKEEMISAANQYLRFEDFEIAERKFRELTEQYPQDYRCWDGLTKALSKNYQDFYTRDKDFLGKMGAIIECSQKATSLCEDPDILFSMNSNWLDYNNEAFSRYDRDQEMLKNEVGRLANEIGKYRSDLKKEIDERQNELNKQYQKWKNTKDGFSILWLILIIPAMFFVGLGILFLIGFYVERIKMGSFSDVPGTYALWLLLIMPIGVGFALHFILNRKREDDKEASKRKYSQMYQSSTEYLNNMLESYKDKARNSIESMEEKYDIDIDDIHTDDGSHPNTEKMLLDIMIIDLELLM